MPSTALGDCHRSDKLARHKNRLDVGRIARETMKIRNSIASHNCECGRESPIGMANDGMTKDP